MVNSATGLLLKHLLVLNALTEVVVVEQSAGAMITSCCQVFGVVALNILYL